jgi:carnitine O-acetyltransferase
MKAIESAGFAVCLDGHAPDSQTESARQLLLDDASNRWYDKTVQLIVFENGRAGLYAEHALIDATVISRLLTDALTLITGPPDEVSEAPSTSPQRITFDLDSTVDKYISDG